MWPRRSSRKRRASARGDPARAGRQRPGRDGGGVHPRRFRCGRRAHVRPGQRPRSSWPTSAASPPAVVSPMATCSAPVAAGPPRSSTTRCCARSSPRSSPTRRKFALGVCNGCQMLAQLKDIIPGAQHWPKFLRNASEQYEARLVTLEILESPSMFFKGMAGSRIPVAVAHGEGRVSFPQACSPAKSNACRALRRQPRQADRELPAQHQRLARWPGRLHRRRWPRDDHDAAPRARVPQRAAELASGQWGEDSPWMRMFRNARVFVG